MQAAIVIQRAYRRYKRQRTNSISTTQILEMKNLADLGLEMSGNFGVPNQPSRKYDLNLFQKVNHPPTENTSKVKTPRVIKVSILQSQPDDLLDFTKNSQQMINLDSKQENDSIDEFEGSKSLLTLFSRKSIQRNQSLISFDLT